MNTKRITSIGLSLIMAAASIIPIGCQSFGTPQSLRNKAKAVAWIASSKALEDRPDWKDEFRQARNDLIILRDSETIGMLEVIAIIQRMPIDELRNKDAALYISGAVMFFSDELGTIALDNPELLVAAVDGMVAGITLALGEPVTSTPNQGFQIYQGPVEIALN